MSNVGGSQQCMNASSVGGTDQANHTIQSTLSASVFQIAILKIKRLGNSSYQM